MAYPSGIDFVEDLNVPAFVISHSKAEVSNRFLARQACVNGLSDAIWVATNN